MKEYIYQLKINGYTFPAVALWNSLGFYCGYLGIDETNGLHVSEEDRPDNGPRSSVRSGHGYIDINVHGGVTFSGYFSILDKAYHGCLGHFVEPVCNSHEEIKVSSMLVSDHREFAEDACQSFTWLGFDCGHHNDRTSMNPDGKERNIDFVLNNIKILAKEAAGSSHEIFQRHTHLMKITEQEHNMMMALAVTGECWAEKYIRDLKVSN